MMRVTRWDPFSELRNVNPLLRRVFDDEMLFTPTRTGGHENGVLAVDVWERDGDLVIKAAVPGIKPEDVDVTIENDVLTIKGETRSEENIEDGDYHRREVTYGSFSRSLRLPVGMRIDEAEAKFENGMLRVTIPLPEEAKPRKVEVKTS